jgi:hypothetical protein
MIVPLPSVAESILASGGTVSTVQVNAEGGLIFPTLSSALTSKIWAPSDIFADEYWMGLEQILNDPPSNEHSR